MKIHFVGILGSGMSGLALWCAKRGDNITGSDQSSNGKKRDLLTSSNIVLFKGHAGENVSRDCDIVVYTSACGDDNPEIIEAKRIGCEIYSYFEYLGRISESYPTIAITGTHGKTTTTGLVCAGAVSANLAFNAFLGSEIEEFSYTNSHFDANANWLILEACEFRRNFLFLTPKIVVLTAIDYDHVDVFLTEDDYVGAFRDFVRKAETVIYHSDCDISARIVADFTGEKIPVESKNDEKLNIFGEFNQRNARLALAVGRKITQNKKTESEIENNNTTTQYDDFLTGVKKFKGAKQRQEYLGTVNGVKIYDDFAHHPVELTNVFQAFVKQFPSSNIGVIVQIHQHLRLLHFFTEFLECLSVPGLHILGLLPVFASRETQAAVSLISAKDIINAREDFCKIETFDHVDRCFFDKDSEKNLKDGDVLLVCSAGSGSTFIRQWIEQKMSENVKNRLLPSS